MSLDHLLGEEAYNLLCDRKLGEGMSRAVFSSRLLPDCVIKVETEGFHQNVIEWETWQRVRDTEASRWFAACLWLSPNGRILIMERTRPAGPGELPDRMPVFLTDFKRQNFGMVRAEHNARNRRAPGRDWLVCHDYGTHRLFEVGMSKRVRAADWWDD